MEASRERPEAGAAAGRSRAIRVALADDDLFVRSALRRRLSLEPGICWVGEAADGLEAIDLVQAQRVDVLVLDLEMPRLDGLQTLIRLRQLLPFLRIVLHASGIDAQLRADVLRRGAAACLAKGTDPGHLVDAIREAADPHGIRWQAGCARSAS